MHGGVWLDKARLGKARLGKGRFTNEEDDMNKIRHYDVTLTGTMPLLLHADNISWADSLKKWREEAKANKDQTKGDDRSPAWTWIGCLYSDSRRLVMQADNISRCLMEGATMVPVPGGKSGKTFKSQSQSGMMVIGDWPLLIQGKEIPLQPIESMIGQKDFDKHLELAHNMGFSLFVKRAKIGTAKHVRVRPKLKTWACRGTVRVLDEQITTRVLEDIFRLAGAYKGLGDWRPSSKTPGSYGMFEATLKEV